MKQLRVSKTTQSGPKLWGEPVTASSAAPITSSPSVYAPSSADYRECVIYGHALQVASMDGRLQCQVCHVYAYCPMCTPDFPRTANLIYCSCHRDGKKKEEK